MTRNRKDALEGAGTLALGLVLRLALPDVSLPLVDPAKVGVVLMCVGALQLALAGHRRLRSVE
ncbi:MULTISPECIES: DUF5708 family protein [unclassified Streptomyces]|uniref:DUF5708 family protein n=1 Tax=unclassified Streptomyces TaxID=2593676 RepID=UPI001908F576|nr:DUF5708 family protein [Streptomyces sp. HSG2]